MLMILFDVFLSRCTELNNCVGSCPANLYCTQEFCTCNADDGEYYRKQKILGFLRRV